MLAGRRSAPPWSASTDAGCAIVAPASTDAEIAIVALASNSAGIANVAVTSSDAGTSQELEAALAADRVSDRPPGVSLAK